MSNFVHLNLHTEYTLQAGVSSIDSFLKKAKDMDMSAIALTDYANMFCAIEFYKKAKDIGIKPIIGLELPLTNNGENIFCLTLLAKNYNGYKNLVKLASELYKNMSASELKINKEILKKYSGDLIALSGGLNGEIAQEILLNASEEKIEKIINEYMEIFSKENFYLEIQSNELQEQKIVNEKLYEIAQKNNFEMVVTGNVYYLDKGDHDLQDVVICLKLKKKIEEELYLKNYILKLEKK